MIQDPFPYMLEYTDFYDMPVIGMCAYDNRYFLFLFLFYAYPFTWLFVELSCAAYYDLKYSHKDIYTITRENTCWMNGRRVNNQTVLTSEPGEYYHMTPWMHYGEMEENPS